MLDGRTFSPVKLQEIATWYLIALSVYHLWTGFISYFAPNSAMKFYRRAYGADPVERRHLMIILRPWGALAVFAGFVGLSVIWQPASRRWVEACLLLLLVMRIGYRVHLRGELAEISRITPGRNWSSIAILLGGVTLLGSDLYLNASVGK
jgi:hypothetical protein